MGRRLRLKRVMSLAMNFSGSLLAFNSLLACRKETLIQFGFRDLKVLKGVQGHPSQRVQQRKNQRAISP